MSNKKNKWKALTEFIEAHSCQWSLKPNDGEWGIHQLDDPPHNRLLGPVFERGHSCGLVVQNGEILCEWGDIHRSDMTFSVTKTYLALVAGVAVDLGVLASVDESVYQSLYERGLNTSGFEGRHNRSITWRHFLQFTSEWEGECFGVPDQIDRYRTVSLQPVDVSHRKGDPRPLAAPAEHWEYNDVRINQFSLALMRLFDRPLPEVFDEYIMRPLGASNQWKWHGYENSWEENGQGRRMQSVPGGGHWGGGMVISAHDQYLVAQLMINGGLHRGKRLISGQWLDQMCTACDIAPWYGYFTWLNTGHGISQFASARSYFAMGIGGQLIWHDPENKLVAVLRWIDMDHLETILQMIAQNVDTNYS